MALQFIEEKSELVLDLTYSAPRVPNDLKENNSQ